MATSEPKKEKFSDEELEEIMDMHAPVDPVKEFRAAMKESPLLVAGLVFTFGLLVGVSIGSRQRKSR